MAETSIEWTDAVWNPVRGCSRISRGCEHCYAERMAARFSGGRGAPHNGNTPERFYGFAKMTTQGPRWTGRVELIPDKLDEPLRWRDARPRLGRPLRVFTNSMSDLFHEALSDSEIDQVFAAMVMAERHIFQVLTKRPERMRRYLTTSFRANSILGAMSKVAPSAGVWSWPGWDEAMANVWLGVSVEDQKTADARIAELIHTPAAVRFISLEPMLEGVDLRRWQPFCHASHPEGSLAGIRGIAAGKIDWVIVGGESGPGARPFDPAWARSVRDQCRAANVACFIKQLGARWAHFGANHRQIGSHRPKKVNSKGGDMSEWPEDLRVREFPE